MKNQIALLLVFPIFSHAAAIHEPPPGKLYFGAWLDTADSSKVANDGDRPAKFNERMNFKASIIQYAQDLPIPSDSFPFPDEQIDATGTNAIAVLTVYPRPTPWNISDADIIALANQCAQLNRNGRRILLRFGPEMNGDWNYWGQSPRLFLALWKRVHDTLRSIAPNTGLVWAPSFGDGYPYRTIPRTHPDFDLLDTNKDGVVNSLDDPYSPYYPGDGLVDWVGLSIYTYGTSWPWSDNIIAPPGKFESILNSYGFYNTYALGKNKPFMVSETNAAFHTNTPLGPGVGQLATAQSWWTQFSTNATFLSSYPQVKAICLFEFMKLEETFADGTPSLRDFRISNSTEIRNAFLSDFRATRAFFLEAGPSGSNDFSSSNGNGGPSTNVKVPNREGTTSGSISEIRFPFTTILAMILGFYMMI